MVNRDGAVKTEGHPFFEALGENGRSCITCHQPSNAMSVSVEAIRRRWLETAGKDPIFAAVDGSDCPNLPQDDARSHSMLINRGLFRIASPWPPKAADGKTIQPEFKIEVESDPIGCNLDARLGLRSPNASISVYRRPRMAANLAYVTNGETGTPVKMRLMTDGRETSLLDQAITAIRGHEEAAQLPSRAKLLQIVNFERQIFTAQSGDSRGGLLTESDGPALLGPKHLAEGKSAPPVAASLVALAGWMNPPGPPLAEFQKRFRESVSRGSALFAQETCTRCHSAASAAVPMEIGTVNRASKDEAGPLPLFKVTCNAGKVIYTEDPGRALVTGRCADVGAIVMQQLRGLAARAPYFSNGSARNLRDVIDFYDKRLKLNYSEEQKQDLENFLKVL
jgi:cytochrome c peroxidase